MRKEELLKIVRGNAKETEIFQMQGKEAVYSLRYDIERKQYIFSFDGWEEYLENMTVPVLKEIWTRQKEQIAEQGKWKIRDMCKNVILSFHENTAIVFDLPNTQEKIYILSMLNRISACIKVLWFNAKKEGFFPSKEFETTCLKNDFPLLTEWLDIDRAYKIFKDLNLLK